MLLVHFIYKDKATLNTVNIYSVKDVGLLHECGRILTSNCDYMYCSVTRGRMVWGGASPMGARCSFRSNKKLYMILTAGSPN